MSKKVDKQYLTAIAQALLARDSNVSKEILAGVTYLGQFISHDIVPATGKGRQLRDVTPYLNLDSVYGEGDAYLSDDGSFPIRSIRDESGAVIGHDVPRQRSAEGFIANIPEKRNDDVVIVTQLHAFLQRLHNAILKSGFVFDHIDARQYTTLIFQLLAIEEFSRSILNKEIFKAYFEQGKSYYNLWDKSHIPAFFNKAAFRFGHSMVRPDYKFSKRNSFVTLANMFTTNRKLTPNLVVDWLQFFKNADETQKAMQIDGKFSFTMASVQPLDRSFDAINLIEKNLMAGIKAGLPNGMMLINTIPGLPKQFGIGTAKPWYSTFESSSFAKLLQKQGVSTSIDDLPLWPFVLLEAELTEGDGLGQIGSILTAEVITNAIAGAQYSVFNNGKYNLSDSLDELGPIGQMLTQEGYTDKFGFMKVHNAIENMEKRSKHE